MKSELFQRKFFREAGANIEILRLMADSMPGVLFNITDMKNRIVSFNKANCANCNIKDETEIVGRKIEEAFPAVLADAYISLYTEVRESGIPVRDRLCAHGADRSTNLRIANVFPVRNDKGKIIATNFKALRKLHFKQYFFYFILPIHHIKNLVEAEGLHSFHKHLIDERLF
jgi:PAS domain-containing protein